VVEKEGGGEAGEEGRPEGAGVEVAGEDGDGLDELRLGAEERRLRGMIYLYI
jgi:hypothetical protein